MSAGRSPVRRAVLAIAVVASFVVAAAAIAYVVLAGNSGTDRPAVRLKTASDEVVKGKVSTRISVQGTLGYARPRALDASRAGVVTWLPEVGERVGFGARIYSLDAQPILLLRGGIPMWRKFAEGMSGGPDVQQLETDLQGMGYFFGTVDQTFTHETAEAVARLQEALGEHCAPPRLKRDQVPADRPTCGALPLGSIVFGTEAFRVAKRSVAPGDQVAAGSPLLGISAGRKIVHADVELEDQRLARPGTKVTVTLPDGSSAKGVVRKVGSASESRDSGTGLKSVVVPTTIALPEQRQVRRFQQAAVTVGFADVQRRDVLSVPVEALVALGEHRFGVEVIGRSGAIRRLPVKAGLFAGGRVVVSGRGIHAGLRVVVPGV
jgi:HlyD family secretion protein/putative peptidoglycan binding protein